MELKEFFSEHPEIAIAFSGGVDSTYLLMEAAKHAKRVRGYYVKSPFQPAFEFEDARRAAEMIGAEMVVLEADALEDERVAENPENRCYYCKKNIFGTILEAAKKDGFSEIADGTNASDDAADRPGMRALEEMKVFSPLRICDMTKDQIREKSKEAGLFTWNKPSYACLATRIPVGERITKEKLERTEKAENALFSLGFSDFRVRSMADTAKIQVREEDFERVFREREKIYDALSPMYKDVLLDLKDRKS